MKQLTVIGNVGMDAQIKTSNGSEFLSFTVAVNERYKKQDGTPVETTDWINVNYRNTKLCPYLKKGQRVLVQGDLKVQTYKGRDGVYKSSINVAATLIEFLGGGKKEDAQGEAPEAQTHPADDAPFGAAPSTQSGPASINEVADDLPF